MGKKTPMSLQKLFRTHKISLVESDFILIRFSLISGLPTAMTYRYYLLTSRPAKWKAENLA